MRRLILNHHLLRFFRGEVSKKLNNLTSAFPCGQSTTGRMATVGDGLIIRLALQSHKWHHPRRWPPPHTL